MQRYSRKRQAILDCLRNTTEHPTAEWICARLKPAFPELSLATVYRNLTQFKDDGIICSVGKVNGQERFDANAAPHTHAVCAHCGRVVDVPGVSLPETLFSRVREIVGFEVHTSLVSFTGICPACRGEKEM